MRKRAENIFWGVLLILAAVCLVLSKMGWLPDVGIMRFCLAILCVAWLISGILHIQFGNILFPIAFLCILFDRALGITKLTHWTVLVVALLGTIALNLIFGNSLRKWKKHRYASHVHYESGYMHGETKADDSLENMGANRDTQWETRHEHFDRVEDLDDGSSVYFSNSFSSAIKYVNSDNLEDVCLECKFGAVKVFFDNAMVQTGNVTVDLNVSFGAAELYVPKEWKVVSQADTLCSGIEEKNHPSPTGSVTMTLTGSVRFAGMTIVYV